MHAYCSSTSHQEICHLIVKMLNTVVDHDVRMPDFVRSKVDGGDVLIVGGHPLESGVSPPHDKPDVGIKCAHLRVHIDVQGDNIQTKCHSSEHSVG